MPSGNPLRDALTSGKFFYMVELVPSNEKKLGEILELTPRLAAIPGMVAAGITSYAGGSTGLDPIQVGAQVRDRGLSPNVHLTCVSRDLPNLRKALEDLYSLGIENVFCISGDYPKSKEPTANQPFYDFDSVQLVEAVSEMRAKGAPFLASVAISPFKYTEADCAYQYLKLEKKIAAGADFAITQVGFDSKKFAELKRYLTERGLKTPLLGNVYELPLRASEKFSKGEPPGCWASPELVERIREEVNSSTDKGLAARMERAAKMVAMLRGLGYAGAYLGGDHDPDRLRWIVDRSEELAPKWEEIAEEISYSPKGGFFYYETPKAPPEPMRPMFRFFDVMSKMFPVKHEETGLRKAIAGVLRFVDKHPSMANTLEKAELAFKKPVFGCQACGNCVLGEMEYVCPMTCPKNMRNGPCGGTFNGQCEVIPEQQCIWVAVYQNAKSTGRVDGLKTYVPNRKKALQGSSSFINLFLNRDNRPEHFEPLITIAPAPRQDALVKK
jgi:methylenetetrahydrofolate reductase (NADPH)